MARGIIGLTFLTLGEQVDAYRKDQHSLHDKVAWTSQSLCDPEWLGQDGIVPSPASPQADRQKTSGGSCKFSLTLQAFFPHRCFCRKVLRPETGRPRHACQSLRLHWISRCNNMFCYHARFLIEENFGCKIRSSCPVRQYIFKGDDVIFFISIHNHFSAVLYVH